MDEQHQTGAQAAAPLNPLPATVWLLLAVLGGIELVLVLAGQGWIGGPAGLGWRIEAIQRLAFSGAIQEWMIETHRAPPAQLLRYIGHVAVQPGPLAAVLALAMVAGLGKAVAERMGGARMLACALVAPVLAAAVFGLILGGHERAWLIGAGPMVFGLVGAWTWGQWTEASGDPARRRRAFGLIGVLLLARLGFGLLAETGFGWIADLAGFAAGFALALALAPGTLARLRRR